MRHIRTCPNIRWYRIQLHVVVRWVIMFWAGQSAHDITQRGERNYPAGFGTSPFIGQVSGHVVIFDGLGSISTCISGSQTSLETGVARKIVISRGSDTIGGGVRFLKNVHTNSATWYKIIQNLHTNCVNGVRTIIPAIQNHFWPQNPAPQTNQLYKIIQRSGAKSVSMMVLCIILYQFVCKMGPQNGDATQCHTKSIRFVWGAGMGGRWIRGCRDDRADTVPFLYDLYAVS